MSADLARATKLGRLTKRSEFLSVAASGLKWVTPGLILQAKRRPTAPLRDQEDRDVPAADSIRVGYTASRKVGSAVVRNRARRRLRAAVSAVLPDHAAPGTDYVLIARHSTPSRSFTELLSDLTAALCRLKEREARK